MTELEEARRNINNLVYIISQNTRIVTDDKERKYLNQIGTALNKAIDCIDKQIPMAVYKNKYCMRCKMDLSGSNHRVEYCPDCGQKIEWSDEKIALKNILTKLEQVHDFIR